MRRLHILPVLAIATLAAGWVLAAPDPASIVIGFHKSVTSAAKAKSAEPDVERAVRKSFDLDAIETSVLADRAGAATAGQRKRLGDLIVRFVAERVISDPDARSGVDLVVTRTRAVGDGAWLVSTRSGPTTSSVSLTWRLRDGPQGPRIVDVLHDGGSMASLERRKLEDAMHGHSLDAALTELESARARGR